jgi:hypothetical protein
MLDQLTKVGETAVDQAPLIVPPLKQRWVAIVGIVERNVCQPVGKTASTFKIAKETDVPSMGTQPHLCIALNQSALTPRGMGGKERHARHNVE